MTARSSNTANENKPHSCLRGGGPTRQTCVRQLNVWFSNLSLSRTYMPGKVPWLHPRVCPPLVVPGGDHCRQNRMECSWPANHSSWQIRCFWARAPGGWHLRLESPELWTSWLAAGERKCL